MTTLASRRGPRPLAGVRVAVTRAEGPRGPLSRRLAELGAEVLNWPLIEFGPPRDPRPLEAAVAALETYEWIVFTSPRAVEAVLRIADSGARWPRVAAVGPSTAGRLRRAGRPIDLEAAVASGEGLLAAFADLDCAGARMLLPLSEIAPDRLTGGLRRLGAEVDRVDAYRTVPLPLERRRCLVALEHPAPLIVTFTSPSAVSALEASLGRSDLRRLLASSVPVAIGETTGEALAAAGISSHRISTKSTLGGVVDTVETLAQEISDE